MEYQIINTEEFGQVRTHICLILKEQKFVSFPAENDNKHYISFLRQLSEENPDDPHYTEWVEAGNNPEDFWNDEEAI